ncbi:MAG: four helix bundle protein [Bacteroidales bacterium]
MEIFEITKLFPKEEIYSLTDQIRRSSRSVCVKINCLLPLPPAYYIQMGK